MGIHYRRDPDACTERAAPQGLSAVGLPCAIQASAAAGTPAPGAVAGAKSQPSFSAVGPASAPPVHRLRPFPENQRTAARTRSEEHTSELQSLMRTSYAVFCLKKKNYT